MKIFLAVSITGILAFAQETQPAFKAAPAPDSETASESTPHHADELARLLQEWTPPGEEVDALSCEEARGFIGHYSSPKPFQEIWVHYATKLGLTWKPDDASPYKANDFKQTFPRLGPRLTDGHATLTIKNVRRLSFAESQVER